MGWKDNAIPAPLPESSDAPKSTGSWRDNAIPAPIPTASTAPSEAVSDLVNTGYDFDKYNKLSDSDKKAYDTYQAQEQSNVAAAIPEGLSQGAFSPVETVNKLTPGQPTPNLRQRLISSVEKDFANALGDDQTKDYYNSIPQEDLIKRNVDISNQKQKASPGGTMVGNLLGSLPANIAAGAGIGTAAKAAGVASSAVPLTQKLVQAGTNIAGVGALGEAQGIANSNADTLSQRATDALPSAALGAGTAGLIEGVNLANTSEGQQVVDKFGNYLKQKAVNAAERSINPSPTELLEMRSPGGAGVVGNKLLDEGLGSNPFQSAKAKADILNQAQAEAGQSIDEVTSQMDQAGNRILDQGQNQLSQQQAGKLLEQAQAEAASKQPIPGKVETTEAFVPDSTGASAEALPEDTSLGFPRNEVDLQKNKVQSNIIPVEKVTPAQPSGVTPELQGQIDQLTKYVQANPSKADLVERVLNKDSFVKELEDNLMSKLNESDANKVRPIYNEWLASLSDTGGEGTSNISLKAINKFKQQLRQGASYGGDNSGVINQARQDFSRELNNVLLKRAQQLDELAGTDLTSNLIKANRQYSAIDTGATAATRKFAKSEAQGPELPKTLTSDAYKWVRKAVNTYGNNFAATSFQQLSDAVKQMPQIFGKFAPALQDAATRGSSALTATHFALYQNDPNYRAIIDPLQEEGEKQSKGQ